MELTSFAQSPLALLAPAVAIGLAVITRKTLPSLAFGALTGALLLTNFDVTHTLQYLLTAFANVFWDDGLNSTSVFIILFLLCLGVTTSFISLAGGTRAFGTWARKRVSSARGSQLLTIVLGMIIFIDDYFNALAVGNICRPITDLNKVPRAKLAYLIDSTAAPVCVITPISSWGAYIIALVGTIMATHGITDMTPFTAFIEMIPMNLYALVSLALVVATAAFGLNVGPMKSHTLRAQHGELYNTSYGEPLGANATKEADTGTVSDLLVPVIVLVLATTAALVTTGAQALAAAGESFSILGAFENTDVAVSLLAGGIIGLLVALGAVLRHRLDREQVVHGALSGAKSMLGAIYILVFAWVLVDVIGNLETGKYLSSLITGSIGAQWLPALVFLISGIMAFSTGTSWGTFGIMLPIAGDMAMATEATLMMPMMASVLAGAVFGDHCSPISDTTILSSTGASCHHMDHVVTQLPYCLSAALISFVGYLVIGMTESVLMGLFTVLVLFGLMVALFRKMSASNGAPKQSMA